jgi:hypothetical protein
MAVLALTTASRVEVVKMLESITAKAGEAITAGAPITFNASGDWINSDGNGAGVIASVHAIATHDAVIGESLTGMKRGILDGYVLTDQAFGAPIYVSDTVGILGDAAGTTNLGVGRVIPGQAHPPITVAHDKLLYVDISYQADIDTIA